MPRTIKIAAIQMNAEPAPVIERLARAEVLVARAAKAGAQLVVLPEVFNTGYVYADTNYGQAELPDGLTTGWMKNVAARYQVHVAGSLLLLDEEDIYNALLLVAPDGRLWRYDKNYPCAWERAYFRQGRDITIADTSLGRLGMMICWDVGHREHWARYAGKVDAMIVVSCPPALYDYTLILPDGRRVRAEEAAPRSALVGQKTDELFGAELRRQSAHLRVPVVVTTPTGTFSSGVPASRFSLLALTPLRPDLWKFIREAEDVRIECGYIQQTAIADARGEVLDKVAAGSETFALAEVVLADSPPQPAGRQPRLRVSPFLYVFDIVFNVATAPIYRRKMRSLYGWQMAPVRRDEQWWLVALIGALLTGFMLGRTFARRRVRVVKVAAPAKEKVEPPAITNGNGRKRERSKGRRGEMVRLLLPVAIGIGRTLLEQRRAKKHEG